MKRENNCPIGQGYEAPKVELVEIESHGVLCTSGGGSDVIGRGVHFETDNGTWGE